MNKRKIAGMKNISCECPHTDCSRTMAIEFPTDDTVLFIIYGEDRDESKSILIDKDTADSIAEMLHNFAEGDRADN